MAETRAAIAAAAAAAAREVNAGIKIQFRLKPPIQNGRRKRRMNERKKDPVSPLVEIMLDGKMNIMGLAHSLTHSLSLSLSLSYSHSHAASLVVTTNNDF